MEIGQPGCDAISLGVRPSFPRHQGLPHEEKIIDGVVCEIFLRHVLHQVCEEKRQCRLGRLSGKASLLSVSRDLYHGRGHPFREDPHGFRRACVLLSRHPADGEGILIHTHQLGDGIPRPEKVYSEQHHLAEGAHGVRAVPRFLFRHIEKCGEETAHRPPVTAICIKLPLGKPFDHEMHGRNGGKLQAVFPSAHKVNG